MLFYSLLHQRYIRISSLEMGYLIKNLLSKEEGLSSILEPTFKHNKTKLSTVVLVYGALAREVDGGRFLLLTDHEAQLFQ